MTVARVGPASLISEKKSRNASAVQTTPSTRTEPAASAVIRDGHTGITKGTYSVAATARKTEITPIGGTPDR